MSSKSSEFVLPASFPVTSKATLPLLVKSDWAISVLLALAAALPALALWSRGSYLTGDSYQYLRAALTFAQGQGLRDMSGNPFTVLSPLYPLLVGSVHRLLPMLDFETTARLVSLAGATAAVIALYWLLRARFSRRISFAAALLFALLPLRVWSGFWILSEGLYLGLLLTGMAVLFRPAGRFWLRALLGGVLLGLAYLTRPEANLFVAAVIGLFLIKGHHGPKRALLIVAGFLLVALPYHAWVYQVTGSPGSGRLHILLAQSQSLYEGNLSNVFLLDQVRPDGSLVSRLGSEMTLGAVMQRYLFFARIEVGRLLYLLGPYLLVLALLIVGAALCLSRNVGRVLREFQLAAAWPFVLASWLLFLPFLHVEDRYLLPVFPAFLFWLVLIVLAIEKQLETKLPQRSKQWAALLPLTLITLFVLSYGYRLVTQLPQSDPSVLARNTARWLEAEQLSPAPILSQNPDLAFFSNQLHRWMPAGEAVDVLKYAQRSGLHYIYVSSQDVPGPLNDLLLGNTAQLPDSVKLLHEESDGSNLGRLYEIKSTNDAVSSNLHL